MKPYIHKDPKHAAQQFVVSLLQIIDGLVGVLTLGFVLPDWSFSFTCWLLTTDRFNHKAKTSATIPTN